MKIKMFSEFCKDNEMNDLDAFTKPQYRVHFLSVGDADAIVIAYKKNQFQKWNIALVDAGNVSDSEKIKNFIWKTYRTYTVSLAVCSHPDKDHKGGFFDLLEDKDFKIKEFWFLNPYCVISDEDFTKMKRNDSKKKACERCFNHPTDPGKNLLQLVKEKCEKCLNVSEGTTHSIFPLSVLGPSKDFYRQAAIGIVQNFAELNTEPILTKYDETAETTEDSARSVINDVKDESFTNMSSLVMMFQPTEKFKLLLTGDSACNSLRDIVNRNKKLIKGCILKVPHHGSKHNLNTDLIDDICPSCAIISAEGNEKHPNQSIVYYLSKYCDVYSTHKSHTLMFSSDKSGVKKATALRKKMC